MDNVKVNAHPVVIRYVLNNPPPDEMDGGREPTKQEVAEACSEVRGAINRWLYGRRDR